MSHAHEINVEVIQGASGLLAALNARTLYLSSFEVAGTKTVPAGYTTVQTGSYAAGGTTGGAKYAYSASVDAAYVAANPYSSFLSANGRGFKLANTDQFVNLYMFGCVNEDTVTTNQLARAQAAWDWHVANPKTPFFTDISIGINARLNIGPEAAPASPELRNIYGTFRVEMLAGSAATTEVVRIRNMSHSRWHGILDVAGQGSVVFASRLNAVIVAFHNCGRFEIDMIRAFRGWYAGVAFAKPNNNLACIRSLWTFNCGSGVEDDPTWTLSGNWSNPTNSGSASSNAQRTTLTLSVFPPYVSGSTIEDYMAVEETPMYLKINGEVYEVKAVNTSAGTVDIVPWLDSAQVAIASGTYTWIFGGGLLTRSGDGQIDVHRHTATNCGIGGHIVSQYGMHYRNPVLTDCGVGILIGSGGSTTSGWLIEAPYFEGNTSPYNILFKDLSSVRYGVIIGDHNLNLDRVYGLGTSRDASNNRVGTELGTEFGYGFTVSYKGRSLSWERGINATASASRDLREHIQGPHRIVPIRADTQTVNVRVQGSGEFHRLFGWRGCTYRYVGTGAYGAPTGSITIAPPTVTRTCSTTNTSDLITLPTHPWTITNGYTYAPTAGLVVGMPVSGSGIPGGTTIAAITSTTQVQLSAAATATASADLTFTGSLNGTFANVVFSGFSGPVDIDFQHTDLYQLTWSVRRVAGWSPAGVPGTTTVGDASVVLTRTSEQIQRFNTELTAARTVTLPAAGQEGHKFRVVRAAGAIGAFNLTVQTSAASALKVLGSADTWCDVEDDGTEYRLVAAGTL